MEQQDNFILQPLLEQNMVSRRKLLPLWIKIFVWIFMIMGALIPFAFVFSILGSTYQISIYGLESNTAFNAIGLIALSLFLLKGITAFGLWTEKDWAIDLAILDAWIGIAVCCFVMLVYPLIDNIEGFAINIRLELLLLIPYLLKLQNIKPIWRRNINI